jgi:hypothetical protein
MRYYAGIGSRQTPEKLRGLIKNIVEKLEAKDYILRSGAAPGADTFFEEFAHRKEIYLPWKGFNGNPSELFVITEEGREMAKKYHPRWDILSSAAKRLMTRNCYQVLGLDLKTPSEFIICWTPEGKMKGGTSQAMRIAKDLEIPIYNLAKEKDIQKLNILVGETPIF